jgi:hypothetical protein
MKDFLKACFIPFRSFSPLFSLFYFNDPFTYFPTVRTYINGIILNEYLVHKYKYNQIFEQNIYFFKIFSKL